MPIFVSRKILLATALTLAALPAVAQDAQPLGAGIYGLDGNEIGTASLQPAGEGVLVEVSVNGLPAAQWIAFHLHEGDNCDASDGFKSAGGHFASEGQDHGFLVDGGPHAGDMPNQYVGADGTLTAEIYNDRIGIEEVSGRTLIIHGGRDDYTSQPAGDAGDRIACGVIE